MLANERAARFERSPRPRRARSQQSSGALIEQSVENVLQLGIGYETRVEVKYGRVLVICKLAIAVAVASWDAVARAEPSYYAACVHAGVVRARRAADGVRQQGGPARAARGRRPPLRGLRGRPPTRARAQPLTQSPTHTI